ncbi:hypothetical protein [Microcoleus sp. herbarium14]|uniref:hypothetical protein n=1 Tax=Microcoleus sp. herbarium14 TaxID=3055439 RepID=UPI002FD07B48
MIEFMEEMLKHHEIQEIHERRADKGVEEGTWYQVWNIWDYIVARRDEDYAENGVVHLISAKDTYRYPNYTFDTYEEAVQFAYCHEQTAQHAADAEQLEGFARDAAKRQTNNPEFF